MRMLCLCVPLFLGLVTPLLAQSDAKPSAAPEASDWRQGVNDLPTALELAAKQNGTLAVCFSSEPLAERSVAAQILGSKLVRDWANQRTLVLALVEFARARTPGVAEVRKRFVESTRRYRVADSPTWLFLNAQGQEIGRLGQEEFLAANGKGELARTCQPELWLHQAAAVLKGGRAEPLAATTNLVKELGWYARFGGQGWTGKRTVSSDEGAMNYTLFVPPGLEAGQKYPLVIWLHGGVNSDGTEIADEDAVQLSVAAQRPGQQEILLIPSAIAGQSWTRAPAVARDAEQITEPAPSMKLIVRLVENLSQNNPIDTQRVVVVGESGGAYGCWGLLEFYPNRFYGAVINSGAGDPTRVSELTNQRIWMIHGEKDARVPVHQGEQMFAALMKLRGTEPRVITDDVWIKSADAADTARFWKHTQSGHVPEFGYPTGIDWVLATH